jgi:aryl-alcohol dehydrogenase
MFLGNQTQGRIFMQSDSINAQAAVVREKGGEFNIEPVRLRKPKGDEVLVRIVATGLCHADLIARDQHFPVPLPVVLGHEGAGVIEAIGPLVSELERGDHVVLSYGMCGRCRYCAEGHPAYCVEFYERNFGCEEQLGEITMCDAEGHTVHSHYFAQSSFATHALSHRINTIKVPRTAPLELLGPLGCGIQTGAGAVINTLKVRPGSSFAVFGAGAVGLSAVMAARIAGAATIFAVDVVPSRLALARELGATHTFDSSQSGVVEMIRQVTAGGVDFALEASGHPSVLGQAIEALGKLGVIGVAGAPRLGARADFDVNGLMLSGKSIRGLIEGDSVPRNFIPELVTLQQQGRFPFEKLVRFYDFSNISTAVNDSKSGVTLKAIVKMPT